MQEPPPRAPVWMRGRAAADTWRLLKLVSWVMDEVARDAGLLRYKVDRLRGYEIPIADEVGLRGLEAGVFDEVCEQVVQQYRQLRAEAPIEMALRGRRHRPFARS